MINYLEHKYNENNLLLDRTHLEVNDNCFFLLQQLFRNQNSTVGATQQLHLLQQQQYQLATQQQQQLAGLAPAPGATFAPAAPYIINPQEPYVIATGKSSSITAR